MITELSVLLIGQFYGMVCLPDLPQMSYTYCTENGLIENKLGQNLQECIDLCERRKFCLSVSYNSFSKMCTHRSNDIEPAITDGPPKCIHFAIGNIHPDIPELLDGCSARQCNNNQVCISKNQGENEHECVTEYCLAPQEVTNATLISKNPVIVGNPNVFICDKGFTGIGHNKIDCLSNGTFSYSDFKCYRNCPPIASIPSLTDEVEIISVSSFQMTINTTATLSFSTFSGASIKETTIKCDEFGQWSEFSCQAKAICPFLTLPELDNGYPNVQNHLAEAFGSEVEYVCKDGYTISTGTPKVMCTGDLHWSAITITCQALMSCERQDLKPIENSARYTPWEPVADMGASWYDDTFEVDAMLNLQCSWGYSATIEEGSTIMSPVETYATCQANGEWKYNEEDVKCMKNCEYPDDYFHITSANYPEVSSDGLPYHPGTTATYTCYDGYTSENLVKQCNTNCEWIGDVNCEIV